MNDRLFFGGAILAYLGLVGIALAPLADPDRHCTGSISVGEGARDHVVVEGCDLKRLVAAGGDRVTAGKGEIDAIALRFAEVLFNRDGANSGAHFRLGADLEQAFGRRRLEILVRARADGAEDAAIELSYEADPRNRSDWTKAIVTPEGSDIRLAVTPPPNPPDVEGVDFLGFRPSLESLGRQIYIERVEFRLAPN